MKAVGSKDVEDGAQLEEVFSPRGAVNQDVVEEHQHASAKKGLQHRVHEGLECRRRVGEAERHDQELKVAVVGSERRFGHVIRMYTNLVVPGAEIQLRKEASTTEFIQKFLDHWYGKFVLHGG